ncbi:MAG: oligosaccharide flippase family protein [Thermoleophilaceae bacterium]
MSAEESTTVPPGGPGGEEHRLARGTLAMQAARVVSIVALLGVATVIGRTYSLAEFGVYGLTLSFASYVLFVQGSVQAAAVREIAHATTQEERDRAFTTTVAAYVVLGGLAGLLIAGVGNAVLGVFDIPAALESEARLGLVGLALVTLVGWPLTIFQNVFHGTQRFGLAAVVEIGGYVTFAAVMSVLVLAVGAPLWVVVAAGGSIPVCSGLAGAVQFLRLREPFRLRPATASVAYTRHFGGFSLSVLLTAVTDIVIYSLDRAILAAFRGASAVGLYEAAVRPQQLIRVLQGTLVVTVLPASSRYVAEDDRARIRELLLRGTRYVVAATVPIIVTFIVFSADILELWLGERYTGAATAMAIFVASWILGANTGVAGSMLWAAGRMRQRLIYAWVVAALNLVLSLLFTPLWGLEGVVLGTTVAYTLALPLFLYYVVEAFPITVGDLARSAWLPGYSLAGGLAAVLVGIQAVGPLDSPAWVVAVCIAAPLAYWATYYRLFLSQPERAFFRQLLSFRGHGGGSRGVPG